MIDGTRPERHPGSHGVHGAGPDRRRQGQADQNDAGAEKSRRAKLTADKLAALAGLGLDWAATQGAA